ncbi:hypothetical protein [Stutzerimonas frequens]|uniref:Uncharacterized protein n=1 Tax=Stutzerimonas frequens TaxID=2968969 RepID=A0ABX6Y019_9GAMM|nr:hypothetical protein [Stutzerimonas frequens]MCQ4304957.1 hypothetical protein [Stutzerimonas frequens]QPT19672.1 hypothetical protein I6G34_10045 [Stutzerimonas frequens]
MKKILTCLALASTLFAANSYAAEIKSGTPITADAAGCELLAQDVTINLSSNVFGAYSCQKANNVIKVATCHKAGSRKIETIKCAVVDKDEDGNSVWNDSSCKDTDSTFESQNFGKAAFATTGGGSVAAKSLAAYCDSASPLEAAVK